MDPDRRWTDAVDVSMLAPLAAVAPDVDAVLITHPASACRLFVHTHTACSPLNLRLDRGKIRAFSLVVDRSKQTS